MDRATSRVSSSNSSMSTVVSMSAAAASGTRPGPADIQFVAHQVATLGRTFVAVDGGMSDNPRVALDNAKDTVPLAVHVDR